MQQSINDLVTEALEVGVRATHPLGGGCVGEVYAVELGDGGRVVAKVDRARPITGAAHEGLAIEGYMLRALRERSALPVPDVLYAAPGLLVMSQIEGESQFSEAAERHAAELLAGLHAVRGPAYGFERDTVIGGLHQPNRQHTAWVRFFAEERLLHFAAAARREGQLPVRTFERLAALAARLEEFLDEPDYPSLLHGDVWTTNVLAGGGQITGFVDPAVYYGHPEVELAFITLFGTFGKAFFERYHALRPIRPGFFERRRDVYNLFPLLVHVRLFGFGYLAGIERTLSSLGF